MLSQGPPRDSFLSFIRFYLKMLYYLMSYSFIQLLKLYNLIKFIFYTHASIIILLFSLSSENSTWRNKTVVTFSLFLFPHLFLKILEFIPADFFFFLPCCRTVASVCVSVCECCFYRKITKEGKIPNKYAIVHIFLYII